MGNGATLLELANVGKTFSGDVVALRQMSLQVHEGDILSLLGPSGCGKSTVLRLVSGLMSPTTGRIRWHKDHQRGSIGFVFQEPTLMPWATVEKNVWLPFRLNGKSFAAQRDDIRRCLELVGLEDFATSYPRELSGGMRMRVSIARALVTKPSIMLMDEPFAALDEITRFKLNNDLLKMREALDCTIIFVTHSVFESVFLSNRIAVMAARPGRVIEEVTIDTPYPRGEEYRTSKTYVDYCRETSEALGRAMDENGNAAAATSGRGD